MIQFQILQTNIAWVVWQTVRRITHEIWELKGQDTYGNHVKIRHSKNKKVFWKNITPARAPVKISAQPHTIVKQICFPDGNVLFLSLFSLSKNWMHNVVWGCAEILPHLSLLFVFSGDMCVYGKFLVSKIFPWAKSFQVWIFV